MMKFLNKEVKCICILIDFGKMNMKYIKGCVKMVILFLIYIKVGCDF